MKLNYRFEIVDLQGKRWAVTLTAARAAKIVITMYQTRGITCTIRPL